MVVLPLSHLSLVFSSSMSTRCGPCGTASCSISSCGSSPPSENHMSATNGTSRQNRRLFIGVSDGPGETWQWTEGIDGPVLGIRFPFRLVLDIEIGYVDRHHIHGVR